MRKHTFLKTILAAVILMLLSHGTAAQSVIAGWELSGLSQWGASPMQPTTSDANLTIVGLTRGAGLLTTGTAAANAWGGHGLTETSLEAAIAGNDYISFTITANSGYVVSVSRINPYNIRRSNSGPNTGQWQYSVGGGAFVSIGSPITWGTVTTAAGNPQTAIELSSIAELQNVPAGTVITIRCVLWGGTADSGTWYINNFQTGEDFVLTGLVSVAGGPPIVNAPTFSPAPGTYFTPQSITLNTITEGATIRYTVNGDEPTESSTVYSAPISVNSTTTIRAKAFKAEMTPSATSTAVYTFPTEVSSIAAMRNGGPGVYRLTGEVVLTLQTTVRNAKYVQDATAAVLIDDVGGVIATTYNIGDGITGLVGTTAVFNGNLQFTPAANPGAATSTGNVIVPKDVELDQLGNFEAQLVRVKNVIINGTGNFVASTNYNLNGGSNPILRTQYSDLDYIGQPIPGVMQDIIGVVLKFNTSNQLVPRSMAEITNSVVTEPTIIVRESVVPEFSTQVGSTDSKNITVSGMNLTGNISITVTGANAAMFSVNPQSIAPAAGTVTDVSVAVQYTPTASGAHTATLTLSSPGANDVTRQLSGTATAPPVQMTPPNVIITEVYGGGGNAGAPFKNDFIELYNTTNANIDLSGWSVQYYSATGTTANVIAIPDGKIIPAKGYFLISSAGGDNGVDLPVPDASGTVNLSGTAGKVVLLTTAEALTLTSATDINLIVGHAAFKDYVAYGTTATPVWGSSMANASNTTSASRKMIGENFSYTQNIGFDFEVVTPTPRNTGLTSVQNPRMELNAYISNGTLRIQTVAGQPIEVFNVIGQRIHTSVSQDGLNVIPLSQRGIVVVKVGSQIRKLTN